MTFKKFASMNRSMAIKELSSIYLNNLSVTWRIINECVANGWHYRVSSSLFPLLTFPEASICLEDMPGFNQILVQLERIRNTVVSSGIKLSSHPDQFNVLASFNPKVVKATVDELSFHGWLLTMMGGESNYSCPINIHMNTYKGDLKDIARSFRDNFNLLDDSVKSRLVLENEDKPNSWSTKELIDCHDILKVPITFDNLHWQLNQKGMSEEDAFHSSYQTWDTVPRFHFSGSEGKLNPRAHADMPSNTPNNFGRDVIWDVEFKAKELALKWIQK
jgi:UV DNA damage endonuclease